MTKSNQILGWKAMLHLTGGTGAACLIMFGVAILFGYPQNPNFMGFACAILSGIFFVLSFQHFLLEDLDSPKLKEFYKRCGYTPEEIAKVSIPRLKARALW